MSEPVADLVPHQPPMRWVDRLVHCEDTRAVVTACPGPESWCVHDGHVLETALVECMAQAVAAAAGYRARQRNPRGDGRPASGMLAAVSRFRILTRPAAGCVLEITVRELKRLGPMLLVAGEIACEGQTVATGELSLHV